MCVKLVLQDPQTVKRSRNSRRQPIGCCARPKIDFERDSGGSNDMKGGFGRFLGTRHKGGLCETYEKTQGTVKSMLASAPQESYKKAVVQKVRI